MRAHSQSRTSSTHLFLNVRTFVFIIISSLKSKLDFFPKSSVTASDLGQSAFCNCVLPVLVFAFLQVIKQLPGDIKNLCN